MRLKKATHQLLSNYKSLYCSLFFRRKFWLNHTTHFNWNKSSLAMELIFQNQFDLIFCTILQLFMARIVVPFSLLRNYGHTASQVVINNVSNCHDSEAYPMYFKSMEIIRQGRNKYVINGEIIVRENIPVSGVSGKRSVQRILKILILLWVLLLVYADIKICDDTHDNDTCTTLWDSKTAVALNLCSFLRIIDIPLSNMFKNAQPSMLCPIRRGSFKFDKISMDSNKLGR